MNVKKAIYRECEVSRVLGVVLSLSRVSGTAPLTIRKTHGRWRVQVSLNISLCHRVVIALLVAALLTIFAIDIGEFKDPSKATSVMWVAEVGIVCVVVIIAAYTGADRMGHVIDCITDLELLNKELEEFNELTQVKDRTEFLVVSSLIFGVSLILLEYSYFLYTSVLTNDRVIFNVLYLVQYWFYVTMLLLVCQFSLVTFTMLATQKKLNNCFGEVLHNLRISKSKTTPFIALYTESVYKKESSNIKGNQVAQIMFTDTTLEIDKGFLSAASRLNRLVGMYGTVSELIHNTERSHAALLVMLVASFLCNLVNTFYILLYYISRGVSMELIPAILQALWIVHHLSKLVMVIEPCHRAHEQLALTKHMLVDMTRYIRPDDFPVISEIKTYFRHHSLCHSGYFPMQLFVLNRKLAVAMLGSITTYLIIVIQMK